MVKLSEYRTKIERAKGRRESVKEQIGQRKKQIKQGLSDTKASDEAKAMIQQVAKATQQNLEYRVSELATLALQAVMESDMKLVLQFIEKRGRTEAELLLDINGNQISPRHSVGGGVVDILGLTLRFGLWSLMRPKPASVFFLDEPLKWLKGNAMPEKGMEIISEISRKLGVQIIMVSHSPELIAGADKVIEI